MLMVDRGLQWSAGWGMQWCACFHYTTVRTVAVAVPLPVRVLPVTCDSVRQTFSMLQVSVYLPGFDVSSPGTVPGFAKNTLVFLE